MTFYADNETTQDIFPEWEEIFQLVGEAVLDMESCPYEVEVSLLITDDKRMREMNRDIRQIDSPTDVLSFPNIDFVKPGDFSTVEEDYADCFEPDTGELILGDIVICVDRMKMQAKTYGHSLKREFSFLIAHSMFHLCGYDHMEAEEEKLMLTKQEEVLQSLEITRN